MKIVIKTIQGKPTNCEVLPTDTIGDLRKKVAALLGIEPANQKLIHYGKVLLDDSKKLEEWGIKENDFIVLMVSKVRLFKI